MTIYFIKNSTIRELYSKYHYINNIIILKKRNVVNKMLKTPKKMFTITSFSFRPGGTLNSKFEAQNTNVKLIRNADGKDNSDSQSERWCW